MTKNIKTVCFLTIIAVIIFLTGRITHMAAAQTQPKHGAASGTLAIDGKKITLSHAYAMAQPNVFDESKIDIAVLLTEKPLPEDTLKDIEDLEDAARDQHNWAFFKINENSNPVHEVIDHPSLGDSRLLMSGFTWAEFTSTVFSKDLIEGSFETKGVKNFGNYKYEINVKFDAVVLQAKLPEPLPDEKTGQALPGGGGEPGKTYMAYHKAVQEKDIATLLKLMPLNKESKLSNEEIRESVEFMAMMSPKKPKITKGYVKGDRAVLYLTATEQGEKLYCNAELVKKDGAWRVIKENWSNTPPKK